MISLGELRAQLSSAAVWLDEADVVEVVAEVIREQANQTDYLNRRVRLDDLADELMAAVNTYRLNCEDEDEDEEL